MKTTAVLLLAIVAGLQVVCAESKFDKVEHMETDLWTLSPALATKIVDHGLKGPRIVGGVEVTPHSEPHQVALNITLGGRQVFCGGSLISNAWILTAAHCADRASKIVAVLGAHNIKEDEPSTRSVPVGKIQVHPDWSMLMIRNDIALLKLERNVELDGKYVDAIRLPALSQVGKSFRGSPVTMTGWGKDSDKSTTISPVLRSVDSTVVSNLYCSFRYFFAAVQSSNICASGWRGKGTCNGDSGGPMYVVEDGKKTIIGITSFGISFGCEWSWPPVFTRVTSYLDWILKTTGIQGRP